MDRERSAEQQHIAVPTTVPFTFLKPSERRCSWRTGKFPYRSEHELARHLSDAQTRVCVWMYRKFPGRIGKWAQSFLHRSPWGFRIIMCVCVRWEGVGLRLLDGNKLKPAKYQTNASEQRVDPEECHLSTFVSLSIRVSDVSLWCHETLVIDCPSAVKRALKWKFWLQ